MPCACQISESAPYSIIGPVLTSGEVLMDVWTLQGMRLAESLAARVDHAMPILTSGGWWLPLPFISTNHL